MLVTFKATSLEDIADHFGRLSTTAKQRSVNEGLPRSMVAALEAEAYAYAHASKILRNTQLTTLDSCTQEARDYFKEGIKEGLSVDLPKNETIGDTLPGAPGRPWTAANEALPLNDRQTEVDENGKHF